MAKGQFAALAAQGQAEHLKTQADTENRFLADQLLDFFDDVRDIFRVTRAIAQENAVRIDSQDFFCLGFSRKMVRRQSLLTNSRRMLALAP